MKRFAVTNREYLAFLNDLVRLDREAEALRWAPRERGSKPGEEGVLCYGRAADGRFQLVADADGDVWNPDWPVFNVTWDGASAYASWLSGPGRPWRLPWEREWEKAARGVDGRTFPWGDHVDPSWCCIRDSHRGRMLPSVVDSFEVDVSVYGLRGMGGNVQDWCADSFAGDPGAVEGLKTVRGGHWHGFRSGPRCAVRWGAAPASRLPSVGFRLVRSLPSGD